MTNTVKYLAFACLLFCLCIAGVAQTVLLGRRQATRSAATAPPIVTDTFNRTDADPMSTTASDGTSIWTNAPGALDSCRILNNELRASAGTASGAMIALPIFDDSQYATVTVEGSGADLTQLGPMVRMQSATESSGYVALIDDGTHISIYRIDDSGTLAFTLIGLQFTITTLVDGDTITLGIVDDILTLSINGSIQGTRGPDATYEFGQPGVYFNGTAGHLNTFNAGLL